MRADLHIHSLYSDGVYTPDEIFRRAKSRGIEVLSITDHDTLSGEEEKKNAAKAHGITYLSGWEISAYQGEQKIHILGYNCLKNEAYDRFNEERSKGAVLRMLDRLEKLKTQGVFLTLDEVYLERSKEDSPVHTMHLARAIAKKTGLSPEEAYKAYLDFGSPAYSDIGRPTPFEAIDCIHACGGRAVVAHPGRIWLDERERERLILALADYGVDGIEGVYSTHTARETEYFRRLAERLGLLLTGGSDTHIEDGRREIGSPIFDLQKEVFERLTSSVK